MSAYSFSQVVLRQQAQGQQPSIAMDSLSETVENESRYVFLSHSKLDNELAIGFCRLLEKSGVNVYIDLMDSQLTLPPNGETANKLKKRIRGARQFILLATENSVSTSKWCQWEVGFADGVNVPVSIAVTSDGLHEWGAEYLETYPLLKMATLTDKSRMGYAVVEPKFTSDGTYAGGTIKSWAEDW